MMLYQTFEIDEILIIFCFQKVLQSYNKLYFHIIFLRDLQFLGCKIMKGIETIKIIVVFYVNNADDFFTLV